MKTHLIDFGVCVIDQVDHYSHLLLHVVHLFSVSQINNIGRLRNCLSVVGEKSLRESLQVSNGEQSPLSEIVEADTRCLQLQLDEDHVFEGLPSVAPVLLVDLADALLQPGDDVL